MESWSVSVPLLLCGVAAFFLYRLLKSAVRKFPPGPGNLTALRCIIQALRDGTFNKQAKSWAQQYGEIVLCRPPIIGDICFINSARGMREVFASKDREMVTNDKPQMFIASYIFYAEKSFNFTSMSTDSLYASRRKLFSTALKFYGDGVERLESTAGTELRRLTRQLEATAGEEIAMDDLLSHSLLCVLTALVTGENAEPDSKSVQAMRDFSTLVFEMFSPTIEVALATLPFLRFVPGSYYKDLCGRSLAAREAVLEHLFYNIKDTHVPGQPRGIIDYMLDEKLKGEKSWITDDDMKSTSITIVVAGYPTTAYALEFLFLLLTHHPDVKRKIQQEIDVTLGEATPRAEDRRKLPYLDAVVWETFRYTAFLPLIDPHRTCADVEIDGFTIPKGTTIYANFHAISRDPTVWDEPEVFRPERFLDPATGQLLPPTHPRIRSMLVFGVGKRTCPGESFARSRIFLYASTLLQKFDVLPPVKHKLPPAEPPFFLSDAVVLEPAPYHLIFRPRV